MSEPKFLTGNLMRHVAVMSVTSSIGLMALFLVDFIDMIFISMLGESELAAAVGYAGAILFFTTSVGIGLAIATGALVARTLGARDPKRARIYASNVLAVATVISVAVCATVWIFVPDLLLLLGASGETQAHGTAYLRIVVPFLPFLVLGMAGGAILRAHGAAQRAMWTTIIGAIVNGVLDPILIFGLDLKLEGAAWASAMSRVAVFAAAMLPIFRHYGGLLIPTLSSLRKDIGAILGLAGPAMATNVATPIGAAYVTATMADFGDQAVAGMAVNGRLAPVAFAVVFALSGAIGPIIGQNFGARRFDRVRETLIEGLRFTLYYSLAISLILFFSRGFIADLFSAEGLTRELIFLFCGPLSLAFFFNGALFCSNAAFNNLNRPMNSTLINWARNTLGVIPFVILGAWWMDAPGVLIGQAAGGVLFGILGVYLAFRLIAAYDQGKIDPGSPRRQVLRLPFPRNPFSTERGA